MKDWLKKYFIPHKGNAHRPHFLKRQTVAYIGLFVLALEVLLFFAPTIYNNSSILLGSAKESFIAAVFPGALTELTNQSRTSDELNVLVESPLLDKAATLKAEDMASKGYFAHTSPIDGKTPWYWFNLVGYKYNYAGENLAINFTDSTDVENAWMNSPTHKANIEKAVYTEIGTGVATGTYQGHPDTIFVAQLFAEPYVASAEAPLATPINTASIPTATVKSKPTGTEVLGAETSPAPTPSVSAPQVPIVSATKIALSSPRHITDIVLMILASLVSVAMLLAILIRVKIQHPDLLLNGFLLLVIVFGAYSVNNFVASKNSFINIPEASTSSSTNSY